MTPLHEIRKRLKNILKHRKLVFSMNNVARITGLARTRLNYWLKKGYIKSLSHKPNTTRVYDYSTLIKIELIQSYLKSGYTLGKATEEAAKGEKFGMFIHDIIKDRVHQISNDKDKLVADFGPLANDPKKHIYFVKNKQGKITAKTAIKTK